MNSRLIGDLRIEGNLCLMVVVIVGEVVAPYSMSVVVQKAFSHTVRTTIQYMVPVLIIHIPCHLPTMHRGKFIGHLPLLFFP